jgi:predicted outer membrane repeat protein
MMSRFGLAMRKILIIITILIISKYSVRAQNSYSLDFDGGGDYVEIIDESAMIANTDQMTLSGWVYPRNTNSGWPDFDGFFGFRNNNDADFYLLQLDSYKVEGRLTVSGGGEFTIVTAENSISSETWHHLALTYDGSNIILYIDGIVAGSAEASGQITNDSVSLNIGKLVWQTTNFDLDGQADEISLWNIALTQQQVQDYMEADLTGETGLVGYWNFNEGSGETANDASGNDNHGTIYGATWSTNVPFQQTYSGPVWHVSTTGSDSMGDGSEENPFGSIQIGLDSSSEGDTVLVESGTYVENIIWPATNGIQLIGSGEENCVIDGDSTARVITIHDSLNVNIDTTTHITGFTIQNGVSDLENITEKPGAGIYCVNASPMLTDCTIKENYSYGDGGGIALLDSSDMIITNIKFQNNMARGWRTPGQWPRYRGKGGGIFIVNSDPVITNVEITDNYAGEYGGGVYLLYSSASFTDFTISGNIGSGSLQKGGGVSCESTPNATFTEGIIADNVGPYLGGGIAVSPAMYDSSSFHVELTNVLIQNNTSRQWGGGIYGSYMSLSGCTIKENSAELQGGGIYSEGEIFFSSNDRCNIYENTIEDSIDVGNDIAISTNYYGYAQSFLEVIIDTFTVREPTEFHATPIDSFLFDILVGLDQLSLDDELIPTQFALHPPYPNPFNPITTIQYDMPKDGFVNITIYDMMGRQVKALINGSQVAGYKSIQWNATNNLGEPVSAGMYIYMIQAGQFKQARKMLLLK